MAYPKDFGYDFDRNEPCFIAEAAPTAASYGSSSNSSSAMAAAAAPPPTLTLTPAITAAPYLLFAPAPSFGPALSFPSANPFASAPAAIAAAAPATPSRTRARARRPTASSTASTAPPRAPRRPKVCSQKKREASNAYHGRKKAERIAAREELNNRLPTSFRVNTSGAMTAEGTEIAVSRAAARYVRELQIHVRQLGGSIDPTAEKEEVEDEEGGDGEDEDDMDFEGE